MSDTPKIIPPTPADPTTNFAPPPIVEFDKAKVGEQAYTYQMADGSQVYGEYSFVTGLEWFDDGDEPVHLIRQRWALIATDTIVYPATPDPGSDDEDEDDEVTT